MCGRFVSVTDADGLVEFFTIDERQVDDLAPNVNVAPTEQVPAVVEHHGRRALTAFRWGLVPHWAKDLKAGNRLINARDDSLARNPSFRDAFARHRCLIPADGFFEWRREGKTRVPFHAVARDETPLALAGLWAAWRDPADPDAPWVRTCTIVTTAANATIGELHDRMPVVLDRGDWAEWLDREQRDTSALQHLLRPAPDDLLQLRRVSQDVNSPRNKDPELLTPVE